MTTETDTRTIDRATRLHVEMTTEGRTITVSLMHAGERVAGLTTESGKDAVLAFNHPFVAFPEAAWPSSEHAIGGEDV